MSKFKYPIAIFVLITLIFVMDRFLPSFWLMLLLLFGINTILAVSLNITNGWANLFSLGHGGIMLAGGYAAAFLKLTDPVKHELLVLQLAALGINNQNGV